MVSAVVIIEDAFNCAKYEKHIRKAVELLLDEISISDINQVCDSGRDMSAQLDQFREGKRRLTKRLFFLVTKPIGDINELETCLSSYYNYSRVLINECVQKWQARVAEQVLKKCYLVEPPFYTQVLYNVADQLQATDAHEDPIYRWDYAVYDTTATSSALGLNAAQHFSIESEPGEAGLTTRPIYSSGQNFGPGKYNVGCVGGTFDHLHEGHKILLSIGSFLCKEKFVFGITGDPLLVNKKHREFLQDYGSRKAVVEEFMRLLKPDMELEFSCLNDIYGPTGIVNNLDVLLVTEETAKGGDMVNVRRKEKGLKILDIFVVKLIHDDDKQDKISSTYIREYQSNEFAKWQSC